MTESTPQTILVVGASGATGRLLVTQLLDRGHAVRALVRSADRLPGSLHDHPGLTVVEAELLALGAAELARLTDGCDAVASCLGHNMTWRGMFGPPYRLVTQAMRRLARALQSGARASPARLVLMNTAGNRNRDLDEPVTLGQRVVVGLIRLALPPHADNENAADYLRIGIGQHDPHLEWCVVRPDTLTDSTASTGYELYPSPTRSAIFDPGRTSRLNVARCMADLLTDAATWRQWRGRMPVAYDSGQASPSRA